MEKYLVFLLILLANPILSQNIKVVDEFDDPIYNVGFYNKTQTILKFSNFQGSIDLSEFGYNDSIIIILENKLIIESIIQSI